MTIWLRRFTAFTSLPVLGAASSLLALPLVARNVTPNEWAALTVGQSLGLVTGILIGLGWPVVGAALVAQASPAGQQRIYADALTSRGIAAAALAPLAAVTAAWLAPGQSSSFTCGLMAVATALTGFSFAWFCVGRSAPREIAIYEVGPRILGLLVGALGVTVTGHASVYPAALAASTLCGLTAYTFHVLGRSPIKRLSAASPLSALRSHVKLAFIETSAASFTLGLGFLAGFALTVPELAGLGSGDRMSQLLLQVTAALSSTVHPWVAVATGEEFSRRVVRAGAAHIALGLISLLAMGLIGPLVSALLFGPKLAAPVAVCWALGAYMLFVNLQTVACRHILVTRRETGFVVRANVAAALLGVPLVLTGARTGGAPGAAGGMAAGELLIFLFALPESVRTLQRTKVWAPAKSGRLADD
ncbi:hypothetical protein GCM10009817_37670 [Terrabacter lapilli]|uniref:O-antigen/teichoic acid export membrane protein n=1 Tax=Terrabacter lapilli TaxID=436231 RepID=A0ABN2SSW9_9MICO